MPPTVSLSERTLSRASEKREFNSISSLELITLPYENPTSVIIDESTLFVKISDKAYSCEFSEISQILPFFEDENRSFIVYDIKELLHTLYPSNEEIPVPDKSSMVLLAAWKPSPPAALAAV